MKQADRLTETVEQCQRQQHLSIDDATLECKERMKLDYTATKQLHHLVTQWLIR